MLNIPMTLRTPNQRQREALSRIAGIVRALRYESDISERLLLKAEQSIILTDLERLGIVFNRSRI